MAAEEIPAWLSCAQCEISPATLECIDEELLYCAPCSSSLHSKRARLHHSVKPFQTCDECEAAVARMRCASCAGKQSEPLVFCVACSVLLHSKKARLHHQVDSISSCCKQEGVLQNDCRDEKTEEIAHTKAEAAIFTQTEDAMASGQDATQAACTWVAPLSCPERLPLSREEEGHTKQGPSQSSKQDCLLSNTRDASIQANTPVGETRLTTSSNAHNTQKAAVHTTEDDALLKAKDPPLQAEDPSSQEAGIADGLDVCKEASKKDAASTETESILEAGLTRTEADGKAFMQKNVQSNKQEATKEEVSLNPSETAYVPPKAPLSSASGVALVGNELETLASTQEAISNREHATLVGSAEGVPASNTGNVAPTTAQQVPLFSTAEASPSTQQHKCPSLSAEEAMANVSKEGMLGGGRPGTPEPCSQIRFAQPPFQSDRPQLSPGYHHTHSHFHSQSPCQGQYQGPHTPPPFQSHPFPHCSPLFPRHFPDSTWPVRAMDFAHHALVSPSGYMPYSNPYYTGFIPQVDHSSSAYTPQRPYGHSQPIFPHENSDSIHSKSNDTQGPGSHKRPWSNLYEANPMPTSDKGGEAFAENLSKKMHMGEGPSSGPYRKDSMPEVPLEKVSAAETCDKISETAASELPPNVLTPGKQLEDSLLSRTPNIDMPVDSAPLANGPSGEVRDEQLAVDSMSQEARPPPGTVLGDGIPLKKPSTGLADQVIPAAHAPIGEAQNEKLVSESLSSEVLSERVPAGALPVTPPPKVPLANLFPKEEPIDIMPGEDELSEFADTFVAGKDSPLVSSRIKISSRDSKEINPKEDCGFPERKVAHKYPTNRLKKAFMRRSLQATQSPLSDVSKEEENSRDSSEPSYSVEDTSADDETFNTKKYRRGIITLEAAVRKGSLHDASNAVTERIRIKLKRGLRCNMPDDDARQTLKSAQRQLTKYNIKQASAFEGCLQNAQALKTGSCMVEFVCTGSSQRGRLDCWTYNLAQIVAKYFATDFCAQRLNVVFYGVTQNAYCAAHAFAATYNRIAAFSADYIPEKLLDEGDLVEIDRNWECPNKGVFCRKSRLAYKNDLIEVLFKIPKWQRERKAVKAERVDIDDGAAHAHVHSVWMEGVPKNASLVKKHGYETMEALTMHCRKACKVFVEKNNWTIVSSKLKDPILW